LQLLKEKGAKEVERHSVALHDAAAAAATERAGLAEETADLRGAVLGAQSDERAESASMRAAEHEAALNPPVPPTEEV
jgi:hypothetical protein